MKKSIGIVVGAFVAMGLGASVHAAVIGGVIIRTYGGGSPTNPNPTFYDNCSASLRRYSNASDGTPNYNDVIGWQVVSASTPGACRSAADSIVNDPNTHWQIVTTLPVCACASPAMGRVIALGADTVAWTEAEDQALDAELSDLKAEYRIDEYFERVEQLVEERIQ